MDFAVVTFAVDFCQLARVKFFAKAVILHRVRRKSLNPPPPPVIEDPPEIEDLPILEDPIGSHDVSAILEDPVFYYGSIFVPYTSVFFLFLAFDSDE